jgi:hypothetical protein
VDAYPAGRPASHTISLSLSQRSGLTIINELISRDVWLWGKKNTDQENKVLRLVPNCSFVEDGPRGFICMMWIDHLGRDKTKLCVKRNWYLTYIPLISYALS